MGDRRKTQLQKHEIQQVSDNETLVRVNFKAVLINAFTVTAGPRHHVTGLTGSEHTRSATFYFVICHSRLLVKEWQQADTHFETSQ